jgi:hypothetical protein
MYLPISLGSIVVIVLVHYSAWFDEPAAPTGSRFDVIIG